VSQESKKDAVQTGDIEGASVEELNQKIGTLEKEKNKEEEYRNYMQLERVSEGWPRALPHAQRLWLAGVCLAACL
jgi:hypothetical protein